MASILDTSSDVHEHDIVLVTHPLPDDRGGLMAREGARAIVVASHPQDDEYLLELFDGDRAVGVKYAHRSDFRVVERP